MTVLYGQERMALFMERGRPTLAGGFLFSFCLLSRQYIGTDVCIL